MATPYRATFRPYVYRVYNADGVLLYIGSSIYVGLRMQHHAKQSRWWHNAKRFTFEAFATEAEARAAEVQAIESEFPRWNIRDRSPHHPDGRAVNYMDVLAMYPDDCRFNVGRSPFLEYHRARRARRLVREARAA